MPKLEVNGVSLRYELLGNGEETIVWTSTGWFDRLSTWNHLILGRLCQTHRVLLWDRRNIGESDLRIDDAPTEHHIWADDMHHLLNALSVSPAYFGGASNGQIFTLMMAHLYPQDVKALILANPPFAQDDPLAQAFMDAIYYRIAAAAESGGMHGALEFAHAALQRINNGTPNPGENDWLARRWADTIARNPSNRERLLRTDPMLFAQVLRKWGDWTLNNRHYLAGLSDEELGQITMPALVLQGMDDLHPRHTAEELYRLLPNAEWVEYAEHYPQSRLDAIRASDVAAVEMAALCLPFIADFLERVRSES